jgi:hypothetical protein
VDDNFLDLIAGKMDRSSTQSLTASAQINCSANAIVPVVGSGGPVTLTSNPQIATPTQTKICFIEGTSNSNTVTIQNGNGVLLAGGNVSLGAQDSLLVYYNGSLWIGYNLSPPSLDLSDFGAQAANRAIMGPASGGSAIPTWRALVDADVPDTITITTLTQITTRNITDLTGSCPDTSVWGGTPTGVGAQCQADDDTPDNDGEVPDILTVNIGAGGVIQHSTVSRCARFNSSGQLVAATADCPDGDTGGGGGGNDPTAIHDDVSGEINAVVGKTTPTGSDLLLIEDAGASFSKKKITIGALEAALFPVELGPETTGEYVAGITANQGLLTTGTAGATVGLIDCAAGEILKRNGGDTAWECSTDSTGGGGGGGAYDDTTDPVVLNTPSKDVVLAGGTSILDGAKVSLDGDANQIQFKIQAHATQTANLMEAEQADGTTQTFALTPAGDLRAQSIQDIDGPGTSWKIDASGAATFTSVAVTPTDDPRVSYDAATAGETDWYSGTNNDGAGDNDDPWELRTAATPGSNVRLAIPATGCTTGQVLKADGSGVLTCGTDDNTGGGGGSGDVTAVGACASGECGVANAVDIFPLFHEGTSDANETQFTVTNPTADRVITFPNASGEVSLLGQTIEGPEIANLNKAASVFTTADATPDVSNGNWLWRTGDATVITDFVDASGDHSDFTTTRFLYVVVDHDGAGLACAAGGPITCNGGQTWGASEGESYGCLFSPVSNIWSCTVSNPTLPGPAGLQANFVVDRSITGANSVSNCLFVTDGTNGGTCLYTAGAGEVRLRAANQAKTTFTTFGHTNETGSDWLWRNNANDSCLVWDAATYALTVNTTNACADTLTITGGVTISGATVAASVTASGAVAGASGAISGALTVGAEAYDATGWNGDTSVPQKDAVRDKIESILDGETFTGAVGVPAEAYTDSGWDGDTTVPTKNDIRDKLRQAPTIVSSSPYTLTADDCGGMVYNNVAGALEVDLLADMTGCHVVFFNLTANTLTIDPNSTDTLIVASSACGTPSAGDAVRLQNIVGGNIGIAGISASQSAVLVGTGTCTDVN